MTKKFILFLLLPVVFFEINGEKCFSQDSPHTIDRINQAEVSDKKWESFKDEVAWFLDYNNPYKNLAPSEDIEEDEYLRKKWSRKQEEFAQSLARADQTFFEFRRNVVEAIAAKFGEGRYAEYASSEAGFDLTNWYIEFMENKLFPYNWKELYENNKKLKKPGTF